MQTSGVGYLRPAPSPKQAVNNGETHRRPVYLSDLISRFMIRFKNALLLKIMMQIQSSQSSS
ncbi:hypothetical protein CWB99_10700 [Pseudoalteromonas rubra]|uniref:Uncharacterized protein n=1 Tax=Pseudoalteromonas rubra TaxID=43658 RepID=A0A5S3WLR4_9GAMM|nr:hypothetical protein [Pseudoalteromonas rubra]TMP28700.1 hypothetical protein CWB99_10700 [Pseudoalteromonas rubra]TMP28762.1 hypothetical protein CWC00_20550 [Pseudoalteromonas rubra]